jgi:hypothetical protein
MSKHKDHAEELGECIGKECDKPQKRPGNDGAQKTNCQRQQFHRYDANDSDFISISAASVP